MGEWKATDDQAVEIYAMFWRLMEMSVSRWGSFPSGQFLMVLTVMLLDMVDYFPTVGELAEIMRLPKSTVSRYVAFQINRGWFEEIIDPNDRRCRRLHLTHKARDEQKLHRQEVRKIAEASKQAFRGEGESRQPAADLRKILLHKSNSKLIRGANRGKKPVISPRRG